MGARELPSEAAGPRPVPAGRESGRTRRALTIKYDHDATDHVDSNEHGDELWPCMGKCKGTGGSGPASLGCSRRPGRIAVPPGTREEQ
jgi:hypothetical protein